MSYKEQLSPWIIVRHLPKSQRITVARFRRRNNAEDHLQLIKQMIPAAAFSIVYDPMIETPTSAEKGREVTEEATPTL